MSFRNRIYSKLKICYTQYIRHSNKADRYTFANRRTDKGVVILVLAGYKQTLWPYVFPRLIAAIPDECDVCIMSAGKFDRELDSLCVNNKWSYLSTHTNDVSLAQNIGIDLHRAAKTIIKIDEDIFLTKNTLRDTLAYHREVKAQGIIEPCFTAPMLNVNGVCYRPLLKRLNILAAYEAKFGIAQIRALGIRATDDVEAAKWLWTHTTPLEAIEPLLERTTEPKLMASVQFSIGAIVFDRYIWDEMNYFPVRRRRLALRNSTLGADEEHLSRMALFNSRPIVVCQHALAGHFSFGKQYSGMLEFLKENPEMFGPAALDA